VTGLAATFAKPFAEQVAAFRLRLGDLVPTARWDDIRRAQHDRAFMVAGALQADLLADLGAAVDKAVSQGTTLEAFRQEFREIVERRGWHGWTGEGTKGGEAWRTRVIYRTNMATSYAAGRMAQLAAGNFKFWVYRHGGSLEPRVQHLGWDGLILPPDHPFWASHAPPNGWGCSCYIVGARTLAGAKRVGGRPDVTLPEDWAAPVPKTGAPAGIDKGWDYAPGMSVAQTVQALAPKLNALPDQPSIDLLQSWLTSELFARWLANPIGVFPLIRISAADAGRLGSDVRVANISAQTLARELRQSPDLTGLQFLEAQRVVDAATHVLEEDPASWLFILDNRATDGIVVVVGVTKTAAGLSVSSFVRLRDGDDQSRNRIAELLGRARKKAE
jgi:hypothetical protein